MSRALRFRLGGSIGVERAVSTGSAGFGVGAGLGMDRVGVRRKGGLGVWCFGSYRGRVIGGHDVVVLRLFIDGDPWFGVFVAVFVVGESPATQ